MRVAAALHWGGQESSEGVRQGRARRWLALQSLLAQSFVDLFLPEGVFLAPCSCTCESLYWTVWKINTQPRWAVHFHHVGALFTSVCGSM